MGDQHAGIRHMHTIMHHLLVDVLLIIVVSETAGGEDIGSSNTQAYNIRRNRRSQHLHQTSLSPAIEGLRVY